MTELTKEQRDNWVRVLGNMLGPYAEMMPASEIQRVRDKMQAYIDSGEVEASIEEKDDFDAEY